MDEEHTKALQSLRERIRAVCIQDQAQWDISWKTVMSDLNSTRRGLMLPEYFFQVLEVNKVLLNRSEGRLLIRQFQEPNGAMAVTKFLRWLALNAPVDHMNPDLLFPQLPQPYRRIQKILEHDIIDVAWSIITTQSVKFKAGNFAAKSIGDPAGIGTDTGRARLEQQQNDYDVARKRSCESTQRFSVDSSSQRAVGITSHSLLPFLIAAYSCDQQQDSASKWTPYLRVVSTTPEFKVLGDFPVEFSGENKVPAGAVNAETNTHVAIKRLSALQLADVENFRCCLAVHIVETTSLSEASSAETAPDTKLTTPTIRESVNVYGIGSVVPQSESDANATECLCQLIAVITPTQGAVASIVLSQDSTYLAVTFVNSAIVAFYRLQCDQSTEKLQPPAMLSPTFQIDLEPTRSPFLEGECEPAIHFLTAPTTCVQQHTQSRPGPSAYALAVCYGLNVLKYLLPHANTFNSSNQPPPATMTPTKSWEYLSKIKSSGQDMTTQFLVVGFEDGTAIVWDVLQDTEYAFLSSIGGKPREQSSGSAEISHIVFCHIGYVVALSTPRQQLYFFDVRERSRPSLTRVIIPPPVLSFGTSRRGMVNPGPPPMSMTSIATATANLPIVLVDHSNGMVVLYDVRSAEVIGSLNTTSLAATSSLANILSSSPTAKHKSEHNSGEMNIAGNKHAVAVVPSTSTADASIQMFSWRDILLTCFPEFESVLQQRGEELSDSSVMEIFLAANSAASSAARPLSITVPDASIESLENTFLKMAGVPPLSPSQLGSQSKIPSIASPFQSSVCLPNITSGLRPPLSESIAVDQDQSADSAASLLMLEPLVPDNKAFFEQYCREYLDPSKIADKEVKLHRKRRELLKIMSVGAL